MQAYPRVCKFLQPLVHSRPDLTTLLEAAVEFFAEFELPDSTAAFARFVLEHDALQIGKIAPEFLEPCFVQLCKHHNLRVFAHLRPDGVFVRYIVNSILPSSRPIHKPRAASRSG